MQHKPKSGSRDCSTVDSPLRTSFQAESSEAKTKPRFEVSRHPNERRNSSSSNSICSFRHLALLISQQNEKHGRCQTYVWLWRNRFYLIFWHVTCDLKPVSRKSRPGNLTGPKSYFEIEGSRKVGCVLIYNVVHFVS